MDPIVGMSSLASWYKASLYGLRLIHDHAIVNRPYGHNYCRSVHPIRTVSVIVLVHPGQRLW
jgi:hypothetical protein